PTADQIENGSVNLTLTSVDPDGDGPFSFDSDSIVIVFNLAVVVNAGDYQALCSDASVADLSGSISGDVIGIWSGGNGQFGDENCSGDSNTRTEVGNENYTATLKHRRVYAGCGSACSIAFNANSKYFSTIVVLKP